MNPLCLTKRITMELSNWCNLASLHKDCPAHTAGPKHVLHNSIIEDVVETCASLDYTGSFAWHMYNEPMADKRLASLCRLVKQSCPKSKGTLLWTNGEYLTVEKAKELVEAGVYLFRVSIYTVEMANKLREIALQVPEANWRFSNFIQGFDSRLTQYDAPKKEPAGAPNARTVFRPCHAPLTDITITHKGQVILCCMDWKHENVFIDLNMVPFSEFIEYHFSQMESVQKNLVKGIRTLPLCRRCTLEREADPSDTPGAPLPPENLEFDNRTLRFDPRTK